MKLTARWILFIILVLNIVGCGSVILINSDGAKVEQVADTTSETDIQKMEGKSRVSSK